jgi:hypothetical protein
MRYSRIILLGLLGLWAVLGVVAVSAVAVHPGIGLGPRTAFGSAWQASDMREQSKTAVYLEGTITAGHECGCQFLETELEKYSLEGDLDGFTCGDRVGVWGTLCPTCYSICMEGTVFVVEAIVGLPADSDGDTVLDSADNCPDIANPGQENDVHPGTSQGDHCEDPDSDGYMDAYDGCPDTPTPWLTPFGDGDCDGFTDTDEDALGTDPAVRCASTPDPDDEDPDPWPPDWDDSQTVNLLDLLPFKPHFGATDPLDPKYDPRFDLNIDNAINLLDLLPFKPFFNLSCTP